MKRIKARRMWASRDYASAASSHCDIRLWRHTSQPDDKPVAIIDVSDEAALVEQVAREIAENEGFDAKDWKYSQSIARAVLAAVGILKKGKKHG